MAVIEIRAIDNDKIFPKLREDGDDLFWYPELKRELSLTNLRILLNTYTHNDAWHRSDDFNYVHHYSVGLLDKL